MNSSSHLLAVKRGVAGSLPWGDQLITYAERVSGVREWRVSGRLMFGGRCVRIISQHPAFSSHIDARRFVDKFSLGEFPLFFFFKRKLICSRKSLTLKEFLLGGPSQKIHSKVLLMNEKEESLLIARRFFKKKVSRVC